MTEQPREIAVPEGNPEITHVVCSADPKHTDEKSHVLTAIFEKQVSTCGCGAQLKKRSR